MELPEGRGCGVRGCVSNFMPLGKAEGRAADTQPWDCFPCLWSCFSSKCLRMIWSLLMSVHASPESRRSSDPSRVWKKSLCMNTSGLSPSRPCWSVQVFSIWAWAHAVGLSTALFWAPAAPSPGSGRATPKHTQITETWEGRESGVAAGWMVPGYLEMWEMPPCWPQNCNFKV